ncbi:LO7 [Micropterus dolomieu adomavirus 2]|uniref:LO7 n=1 Tax=Micropterus dolomieu adomavirus 2 TaxID=2681676 RepID=A0A650BTU7_9VIRU|nr:LO7 [Micropterus dolomieu adomavirus 2]
MTTSDPDPVDGVLTSILEENMCTQFVKAELCESINQRVGSGTSGPQLNAYLNGKESNSLSVSLPCDQNEAIVMGTIRAIARVQLKHTLEMQDWHVSADRDAATRINLTEDIAVLPALMLNSQFAVIDMSFYSAQSTLRVQMPLSRNNQQPCGCQAFLWRYFNEPSIRNTPHRGHTDVIYDEDDHAGHRELTESQTEAEIIEILYHPLNTPVHCLSQASHSDIDGLKCLPPGCSPNLLLTPGNYEDRIIVVSQGNVQLAAHFTSFQIVYTTVTLPTLSLEKPLMCYPVIDMHVSFTHIVRANSSAYVVVTSEYTDLMPQFVALFAGPSDMFAPRAMARYGPVIPQNAIEHFKCIYNGANNPWFQQQTTDGCIRFSRSDEMNTMRCGFLGKAARGTHATPKQQLSLAEVHLTGQLLRNCIAANCVLIVTDPSTQLHREGCAGALGGKLAVEVHVNLDACRANTVIWCVQWQKFDVCIHTPGQPQGNMLAIPSCRPSYAKAVAVNPQTVMHSMLPLNPM